MELVLEINNIEQFNKFIKLLNEDNIVNRLYELQIIIVENSEPDEDIFDNHRMSLDEYNNIDPDSHLALLCNINITIDNIFPILSGGKISNISLNGFNLDGLFVVNNKYPILKNISIVECTINDTNTNLSMFPNIETFNVYHTHINTVPDFSMCTKLSSIVIDNSSTNSIINSIDYSKLINLRTLSITDCDISGNIPINLPISLTYVNLENNKIDGYIPDHLGSLINLKELRLNNNKLNGDIIPLELLDNIKIIDVSNNNLSGEISDYLLDLPKLKVLLLFDNKFTKLYHRSLSDKIILAINNMDYDSKYWKVITNPDYDQNRIISDIESENNNIIFLENK